MYIVPVGPYPQVADQGAVSLSTLGTLFVAVSEINPDAPRFAQSEYVVALAVGDPLGTEVVQALATEPANNCSVGSGAVCSLYGCRKVHIVQ